MVLLSQDGIEETLGKIWAEMGLRKSNRESEVIRRNFIFGLLRDLGGRLRLEEIWDYYYLEG